MQGNSTARVDSCGDSSIPRSKTEFLCILLLPKSNLQHLQIQTEPFKPAFFVKGSTQANFSFVSCHTSTTDHPTCGQLTVVLNIPEPESQLLSTKLALVSRCFFFSFYVAVTKPFFLMHMLYNGTQKCQFGKPLTRRREGERGGKGGGGKEVSGKHAVH